MPGGKDYRGQHGGQTPWRSRWLLTRRAGWERGHLKGRRGIAPVGTEGAESSSLSQMSLFKVLGHGMQAPQRVSVVSTQPEKQPGPCVHWKEMTLSPLSPACGSVSRLCPAPLICLPALCQRHTGRPALTLQAQASGSVTPPTFSLLSWMAVAVTGPLRVHINFRINLSISTKKFC